MPKKVRSAALDRAHEMRINGTSAYLRSSFTFFRFVSFPAVATSGSHAFPQCLGFLRDVMSRIRAFDFAAQSAHFCGLCRNIAMQNYRWHFFFLSYLKDLCLLYNLPLNYTAIPGTTRDRPVATIDELQRLNRRTMSSIPLAESFYRRARKSCKSYPAWIPTYTQTCKHVNATPQNARMHAPTHPPTHPHAMNDSIAPSRAGTYIQS